MKSLNLSEDEAVVDDEKACSLNLESSAGKQKVQMHGCLLVFLLGQVLGLQLPEWIDDGMRMSDRIRDDLDDDLVGKDTTWFVEGGFPRPGDTRESGLMKFLVDGSQAGRRSWFGPLDVVCIKERSETLDFFEMTLVLQLESLMIDFGSRSRDRGCFPHADLS